MNKSDKLQLPNVLIRALDEDLPSLKEIEAYAESGVIPECCQGAPEGCAQKMLLSLTHTEIPQGKATNIWRKIVKHEKWLSSKIGRKVGISVAALDYLVNISGCWDEAVITESQQLEILSDTATTDSLTGLHVREIFDQWLKNAAAECQRYKYPLSLLMADIDDFKLINDNYGHQTGDDVLKGIGEELRNNLRTADFASRYGGMNSLLFFLTQTARRLSWLQRKSGKEFWSDTRMICRSRSV